MFLTVISTHEDTTSLNNELNERVPYLKLSSYFVYWRLASYTYQYTYSSDSHIQSVALTNTR